MRQRLLILLLLGIAVTACKKDKDNPTPTPQNGNIRLKVEYNFDGKPLYFDTAEYTVAAGYKVTFERLQYYISNLEFAKQDSTVVKYTTPIYTDAKKYLDGFLIENVTPGKYFLLDLYIGLDADHNKSYSLPATQENINMEWPDAMGGGYHFLKLEGQFTDTSGKYGYAMHLGKNDNLINHNRLQKNYEIKAGETTVVTLKMNVAEWFKNPYTYDFNKDGSYSMGNMAAMQKIAANGKDVFIE